MDLALYTTLIAASLIGAIVATPVPIPCEIIRVAKWTTWDEYNPLQAADSSDQDTYKAAICKEYFPESGLPADLEVLYLSKIEFPEQSDAWRNLLANLPDLISLTVEMCDVGRQATEDLFRQNTKLQYVSITQTATADDFPAEDMLVSCPELQVVVLASCRINRVDPALFANNIQLRRVDMSQNHLTDIDEVQFAFNPSLQVLSLQGNYISAVSPSLLSPLTQLKEVDMSRNVLRSLPDELFSANLRLEEVYLDGNEITDIPADLFDGNSELRRVAFSNNRLSSLPTGLFSSAPHLYVAKFADNAIPTSGLPADLLTYNPEIFYVTFRGNAGMLPQLSSRHHGVGEAAKAMIAEYGHTNSDDA